MHLTSQPTSAGAAHCPWISAGATVAGKVRAENEDAILDSPSTGLWAVADGMGGHSGGDYASTMVVTALASVPAGDRPSHRVDNIEDCLIDVNGKLYRTGALERHALTGTTVVALLAFDRFCVGAWAGDSRLYRYRGGQLEQMSRDHSRLELMRAAGLIPEVADAASASDNVITRAVGAADHLHLDYALWSIENEDCCLLCSDGLYNGVSQEEIGRQLAQEDPRHACQSLLDCALSGEAKDNISAIVVRFVAATDTWTRAQPTQVRHA